VTDTAPLLQTESTQVGAALGSKRWRIRRWAPPVRLPFWHAFPRRGAGGNQLPRCSRGGFSANGVRSNGQNNFLLNGVDNNVNTIDFANQTSYSVGPSVTPSAN